MVRDARWGSRNGVEGIVFWTVVEKLCLERASKNLLGRSPKFFVWTVIEIFHLDSRQNISFGRSSKFVFWTDVQNLDSGILSGWASKNFFWEVQIN